VERLAGKCESFWAATGTPSALAKPDRLSPAPLKLISKTMNLDADMSCPTTLDSLPALKPADLADDLADLAEEVSDTASSTSSMVASDIASNEEVTFMLRNFPKKCTQREFLATIDAAGFRGSYDFFYLPLSTTDGTNRGYGFINFPSAHRASEFSCCFDGCYLKDFKRKKALEVKLADVQGYDANYKRFLGTRMHDRQTHDRPLFMRDHQVMPGRAPPLENASSCVSIQASRERVSKNQSMSAKFCPFCGSATRTDFRFCMFCGESIQGFPIRGGAGGP
jgi:hypothetical protein